MKPAFLFSSTGLLCTCALLCASVGISMHPPAAVREERNHGSDYPREAALYRALSMRDERGVILPNGLIRAHEHVKRMKEAAAERRARNQNAADNPTPAPMTSTPTSATASSTAATAGASAQTLAWTWVGPGNIGGRVRALVMHPTNLGTMFAGSAGGGIWKTTDSGTTWAPVDDFLASLAVTSIVMQPGRPDTMYAATGEGFGNLDAIRGAGIFKSTDAGATWTQLPATANGAFWYVNRLAVSPDGKILLAATSGGAMRRSIDGGASFTQVLADAMADVKFHPTDSAKAIAGGVSGGVWVTSDGGASWTAAIGVPRSSGRCELAYARSNPLIVYASCAINGGWLYRSQDGGASFALAYFGPLQLLERQGWYANALWVNPTNAHDVLVGGGKLNHSTDGGASFTQVADINTQHPDLHAIVETPSFDGSTDRAVYIASDGGISRADDVNAITLFSSTGWHSINHNLGVTQFYSVAASDNTDMIIGGTQDNATLVYAPATGAEGWKKIFTGDGGPCAIDPTDPSYVYGSDFRLQLWRRGPDGQQVDIDSGLPDSFTNANFIAPMVLDPNNPLRMLAGGASLWRSDDVKTTSKPTWVAIMQNHAAINAVAIARGNSDVVWFGDNAGAIYRTTNGTAAAPTWTRVDAVLPRRLPTHIRIDPFDSNTVYVTYGGFTPDNVWRTQDGGATWTAIAGSGATALPAAPVRDVAIDSDHPGSLFVGTEVGIFHSSDTGATWELPQDGPANVSVEELAIVGTRLVAATHGRGVYVANLGGTSTPAVTITPTVLSFSDAAVGSTSSAATITLTDSGTASLVLGTGGITGANATDFRIASDACSGATLAPAASCRVTVVFAPSAAGSLTATISIPSNASGSPHTIALSGNGTTSTGTGPLPVVWIDPVNVSVTAATITKNGGCNGCSNGGAHSQQELTSAGGYVEVKPAASARSTVGIGPDHSASTDPLQIAFGFAFWPGGGWDIRESGVYRTEGTFVDDDIFRIAIEGTVVRYYRNGALLYQSDVTPTAFPYVLDATIYTIGGTVANATIQGAAPPPNPLSAVTWTNLVKTTVEGTSLTKTFGCDGCPDAGANSQQTVSTTAGYVEFVPVTGGRMYVGLGHDTTTSTAAAAISFAFSFWPDGTWDIRESDVYRTEGGYVAGDKFRVAIDGTTVIYYRNTTVVYRSSVAPTLPLIVDATFYSAGATVQDAVVHR